MYTTDIATSFNTYETIKERQKELLSQSMINIRKHKLAK
jgi:hypothetical protein